MASLGEILGSAFGGDYNMGRPLDEEELRLIEELRAQGAYVPQERRASPFSYGAGTASKQNLANIRGAIQPEQKRKMQEIGFQRGRGARDALAMEQQQRRQQVDDAIRKRAIADQGRRRVLGDMPTTSPQQRFAADQARGTGPSIMYRSADHYAADAPPQITPQEQDELAVLQREITPSLTQAEALKQAQQKTVTGQIDVETKRRADDLAKQVHSYLPSDYAKSVADSQVLGLELKTLLDTQRLAVSKQYGRQLLETEADASLAAKKQEIRAIEALEEWLGTPEGIEFLRLGGPQREAQRMKLTALRIQLMEAENRQTSLRGSNWWDQPNSSGGSSGGGGSSSGWNPDRPTINWGNTNAPPVNPSRRFP